MNKEEIKHFKSLLRQGSLRHMNILLDDKFQKELLTIIKDYEKLQQENKELKKQLEVGKEQYNDLVEEKEILQEQLSSNTLQLEELKEQVSKGLYSTCLPYRTGYDKAVEEMEMSTDSRTRNEMTSCYEILKRWNK